MNRKQTKTGDLVQASECRDNEVTYGVIAIKLKHCCRNLQEAESILIKFMQQLQPTFAIQHSTGNVITTKSYKNKTSVIDYWQDEEKRDWKVKGCTDGKTIAVLYIKNISFIPVSKEECFLNGGYFTEV